MPDLEFAFEDVRLPLPNSTLGVGSPPPWSRRTALAPGRILVVTATGVSAIDAQGRMAWAWRPEGTTPSSITLGCAAGVAIASVDVGSGRRYLQALDARGGIELWRLPILDPGLSSQPVLSSNRVVLLPARGRKRCLAVDLFTGRDAVSFQIDAPASPSAPDEAWIDGDLLVVPWFLQAREPSQNQVLAYDLATGSRAWRVAFGDDRPAADARPDADRENEIDSRELAAVLQYRDRTWLLVRPPISLGAVRPGGGTGDRSAATAMLELSTRIGAASPLPNVRIAPTDRILGLVGSGRVQIASPVLFLLGNREGSTECRVRAVDLTGGELWSQSLKPSFGELANLPPPFTPVPYPALSEDSVALVYSLASRTASSPSTLLECLDRQSGKDLGSVPLSPAMGRCDSIQMHPLGTGLLLRGQSGIEVVR
jgi:outer membrane protein assembly factor BamB